MPAYTFVARLLIVSSIAAVLAAPAAFAKRATCRDIDAALKGGKTPAQVEADLGTTPTRIEACRRIAIDRARHAERRAALVERHSERLRNRD
jgi:hypothetical protein